MSVCCECCVLSGREPAAGRSLVQRIPTECGVSECDREASTMRRSWPTWGCCDTGNIQGVPRVKVTTSGGCSLF